MKKRCILYSSMLLITFIGIAWMFQPAAWILQIMGMAKNEANTKTITETTTIVIDPGHGGYDTGSIALNGTYEKEITLAISLKTGALLSAYGYHVVYTRTSDEVSWSNDNLDDLSTRVSIAEAANADYYISIHVNSSEYNDGASGFEIYLNGQDETILQIASRLESALLSLNYTEDRGIKTTEDSSLYVIDKNSIPAMLIELGFISDNEDVNYLCSEAGQAALAQQLADSIYKNVSLTSINS